MYNSATSTAVSSSIGVLTNNGLIGGNGIQNGGAIGSDQYRHHRRNLQRHQQRPRLRV